MIESTAGAPIHGRTADSTKAPGIMESSMGRVRSGIVTVKRVGVVGKTVNGSVGSMTFDQNFLPCFQRFYRSAQIITHYFTRIK